ncbi:Scd6-like Sm domain-containing protein [Lipomyces japonicus]|uniref:Scd6-like Sm domain-containing protein n=1 Tax=Lipomyces japonicus TaxID=56871 RepID=UPI0034CE02E5
MSQFIGSKISLFSNSDIRYVGILHEIDSNASTLTLKDVRSMGSEGRKGNPAEEVPPNDNIYEHIVFRGSEVKDLVIEDSAPTPPPPPPAIPSDPAILQNSAGFYGQPPLSYPQQQQPQPGFIPPYYPQQQFAPYHQSPLQFGVPPGTIPPQAPQPPLPQPTNGVQRNAPLRQPAGPPAQQHQPPQPITKVPEILPEVSTQGGRPNVVPAVPVPRARQQKQVASASSTEPAPVNAADELSKKLAQVQVSDKADLEIAQAPTGPAHVNGHVAHRARGPRGRGGHGFQPVIIPKSDFDFEEANAKFDKDEVTKEVVGEISVDDSSSGAFYDRTSSFFDNLSSTSKTKETERYTRHEERQLNIETFGQVSVDTGRFRGRRGRGRGGRGRGYYNNNSNRNGYNDRQQQTTPAATNQ